MNNKVALFFGNYEFSWLLAMNLVSLYYLFDQLPGTHENRHKILLLLSKFFLFLVIFKQSLNKGPKVSMPGAFLLPHTCFAFTKPS